MAVEIARFDRCNRSPGSPAPNDIGVQQFSVRESRGVDPDEPDPYFYHLLDGKRWWEWTLNYIADMYDTAEWPGWVSFELDFQVDPSGLKQLKSRVAQGLGSLSILAIPKTFLVKPRRFLPNTWFYRTDHGKWFVDVDWHIYWNIRLQIFIGRNGLGFSWWGRFA